MPVASITRIISASFTGLAALATFAAFAFAAPACASAPKSVPDGFWIQTDDSDYPGYLKIKGDSGFRCVGDGKSSYLFRLAGDSMTTQFNGMNGLAFNASTKALVQNGQEKGEAYAVHYAPIKDNAYPASCVEEEAELKGEAVSLRRPFARGIPVRTGISAGYRDWLGRASPTAR